jgi:hypothetical protein
MKWKINNVPNHQPHKRAKLSKLLHYHLHPKKILERRKGTEEQSQLFIKCCCNSSKVRTDEHHAS